MSQTNLIFCAPSFRSSLKEAFPKSHIIPFSETIEATRAQISLLDDQDLRDVTLLFQASLEHDRNERVIDHINLSTENTLIGPADLSKGPRFPDMSSVYEHSNDGVIIVLGQDADLENFEETWIEVPAGIWEAIALKHRSYKIYGYLIADLDKWISDNSD